MKDGRKLKPADLYNFSEGISVIAVDDLKQGDLVVACGLSGRQMLVRKATSLREEDLVLPLFIAKHDMPGCGSNRPVNSNYGIVLPWLVLTKNVDTQGCAIGDLVVLAEDGAHKLSQDGRHVGHVLRVGPPSAQDGGDPNSGVILLKP